MKSNYLKKHIEAFFTESTAINANLHIIDTFLLARCAQVKKDFPVEGYQLYSMMTTYRDLSQLEGGNNLYDTGNRYYLTTDNLDDETSRLLSYVSCLTISQIFEVFESFLKNVLTESAYQQNELIEILKIESINTQFDSIRSSLYKIQGTNNKGLIKSLRKVSPFFKQHEHDNIWGINMSDWFNLIASIRHIVIHNRQIVGSDFDPFLKSYGLKKLFDRHFSLNGRLLVLTTYEANTIIDYLYQYAHLIYKGLSKDFELELDFNFKPVR